MTSDDSKDAGKAFSEKECLKLGVAICKVNIGQDVPDGEDDASQGLTQSPSHPTPGQSGQFLLLQTSPPVLWPSLSPEDLRHSPPLASLPLLWCLSGDGPHSSQGSFEGSEIDLQPPMDSRGSENKAKVSCKFGSLQVLLQGSCKAPESGSCLLLHPSGHSPSTYTGRFRFSALVMMAQLIL